MLGMFKSWGGCLQGANKDVATFDCIPTIFSNVVNAILVFSGLAALVIFMVAGFKLMNSAGDPKKLEGAKNSLIFGAIGLIIVLLSFFALNVISYVTGVKCIEFGSFGFDCP